MAKKIQRFTYSFLWVCCLLFLSCGNSFNKRISMGLVPGWAEGEAITLVAQEILSRKDYHVVLQKAATNLLFASMNNGDTDIYMDVWLPKTHGDKVARFDHIKSVGITYDRALLGLVVPDYVPISSISELNAHRDAFGGRIIGIERGSGIATGTDKALDVYQLDYEQLNSSTVAMISELQKAVQEKQWIVITGWKPHWMFSRFELKFLEDPKQVYGEAERIETYVRSDLDKDFPEVVRFLKAIHFDDATLAELLAQLEESKNQSETVKKWVDTHQDLVNRWWSGGSTVE